MEVGPASCWQRLAGEEGACFAYLLPATEAKKVLGNIAIAQRTWMQRHVAQRHAGAPWGGSMVLHPMPFTYSLLP